MFRSRVVIGIAEVMIKMFCFITYGCWNLIGNFIHHAHAISAISL